MEKERKSRYDYDRDKASKTLIWRLVIYVPLTLLVHHVITAPPWARVTPSACVGCDGGIAVLIFLALLICIPIDVFSKEGPVRSWLKYSRLASEDIESQIKQEERDERDRQKREKERQEQEERDREFARLREKDTSFIELCKTGTLQQISDAIKNGANVNAKGAEKPFSTVLMLAAGNNSNPEVITALISAGAYVDASNDDRETALMRAAKFNSNPEICTVLINAGANVNARDSKGFTPLIVASAKNPNPEVIKVLIKAGANIEAKDEIEDLNNTPLHWAVTAGASLKVITALIEARANLNASNSSGVTPLMAALQSPKPDPEVITALVKAGADAYKEAGEGLTAIMLTANPEVIATLVKAGVNVNAKNSKGWTPLMWAVQSGGTLETITALLEAGTKVNETDKKGITALMFAAASHRQNDPRVTTALIEAGADVNAKDNVGSTALIQAILTNKKEVITALLAAGADIEAAVGKTSLDLISTILENPVLMQAAARDPDRLKTDLIKGGRRADIVGTIMPIVMGLAEIHASGQKINLNTQKQPPTGESEWREERDRTIPEQREKGDANFIELCKGGSLLQISDAIKNGANVEAADNDRMTALMYAAGANPNPEVITALIKAGADVNAKDKNGFTPLIYAALCNSSNPGVAIALIEARANVNANTTDGLTPLVAAVQSKSSNPEVITALIKAGADAYAEGSGGITALAHAVITKKPETITALVKAGVDVNAKNSSGRTALMWAVMYGTAEQVTTLLKVGAKVNEKDNNGETALILAAGDRDQKDPTVIKALIEAGAIVNDREDGGSTALSRAILRNKAEFITVLVAAGADIEASVDKGMLAMVLHVLENPVLMQAALMNPERLKADLIKGGMDADNAEVHLSLILGLAQIYASKQQKQQQNEQKQPPQTDTKRQAPLDDGKKTTSERGLSLSSRAKNWKTPSTRPCRVVHYINQFFAGIGGEEKADIPPEVRNGPVGPGTALKDALGVDAEIVATVICGDIYYASDFEKTNREIIELIEKYNPDAFIAGPAFNSSRFGTACGGICEAVSDQLNIPVVSGMFPENPGVIICKKFAYVIKTGDSAEQGLKTAAPAMGKLLLKLLKGEPIGNADEEGYI